MNRLDTSGDVLPRRHVCVGATPLWVIAYPRRAWRLQMAAKQDKKIHHRGTEARRTNQSRWTFALGLTVEVFLLRFSVPLCLCGGSYLLDCLLSRSRPDCDLSSRSGPPPTEVS